ncbi:hypothetical protein ASF10_22200 [Flavobacterium sp. Leaf82]|uniref:hypothetical protein n=1 Tax=Flavobacterium sp. Leaf82 TaxID=1736238 RepID=UPI0006F4FE1D|nr:hypothetical protein [Flavobacterium sp. Leaf82]KQO31351.1 hypothetical protein ASF10_22200 [Flavobacterium sp. Leaf82]
MKPIKMNFHAFEIDNDPDLTLEQRIDKIREMGYDSQSKFDEKYTEVASWYKDHSQLYILSYCMFYFMIDRQNRDEEAETGSIEFPPYYMELLQAIALTLPYTDSGTPLFYKVSAFKESMKQLGELNNTKFYDIPDHIKTIEQMDAHQLRIQMMAQTTAVRNWSYEHLMQKVTKELSAGISDVFKHLYGFEPQLLIELLDAMTHEVEIRVNSHIDKQHGFIYANDTISLQQQYENIFKDSPKSTASQKAEMAEKYSLDQLKDILWMMSDLELQQLFIFDLNQMESLSRGLLTSQQIKTVMDKWSMKFGELAQSEKDHFMLSNPVQSKPFIKLGDDHYFSSLWTVMTHMSISLLELLVAEDSKLQTKYNDYRGEYLEQEVEKLCRQAFPGAAIYAGSMWPGSDNKLFENDVLVVIDSFALVIEAKAGTVSPSAKRGAPERLFKTLQGLIEEPSHQALGFINYLKANKGELSLKTKKGPNNRVDTRNIKFFIPLGITLSHLGAMGSNLKMLINAGVTNKKVTELAPSMSLTDLHVVFDMLPGIPQKLHYLQRRREIEANVDYFGDEIDLLAWYIDSAFALGKDEYEEANYYQLTLKSKELDPYIIGRAKGIPVEKPALKFTPWWQAIIGRQEKQKKQLWLENSFLLLNIGYEDQQTFEYMIKDLIERIKKGETTDRHNYVEMDSNTSKRRYVCFGYPYTNEHLEERGEILEEIMYGKEDEDIKGIFLIGTNIDKKDYPYSIFASKLDSTLFDAEFFSMVSPTPL